LRKANNRRSQTVRALDYAFAIAALPQVCHLRAPP